MLLTAAWAIGDHFETALKRIGFIPTDIGVTLQLGLSPDSAAQHLSRYALHEG